MGLFILIIDTKAKKGNLILELRRLKLIAFFKKSFVFVMTTQHSYQ